MLAPSSLDFLVRGNRGSQRAKGENVSGLNPLGGYLEGMMAFGDMISIPHLPVFMGSKTP